MADGNKLSGMAALMHGYRDLQKLKREVPPDLAYQFAAHCLRTYNPDICAEHVIGFEMVSQAFLVSDSPLHLAESGRAALRRSGQAIDNMLTGLFSLSDGDSRTLTLGCTIENDHRTSSAFEPPPLTRCCSNEHKF